MNVVSAGALGGLGRGMENLGQTILQATLAKEQMRQGDERLKQGNKWIEANLFKKAAHDALTNQTEGYSEYLQRKATADATMKAVDQAPLTPTDRPISQVARMLPEEPTQMGSAALLAKRF